MVFGLADAFLWSFSRVRLIVLEFDADFNGGTIFFLRQIVFEVWWKQIFHDRSAVYVRSHRCALARFARSGSELLDQSALYTFCPTHFHRYTACPKKIENFSKSLTLKTCFDHNSKSFCRRKKNIPPLKSAQKDQKMSLNSTFQLKIFSQLVF